MCALDEPGDGSEDQRTGEKESEGRHGEGRGSR